MYSSLGTQLWFIQKTITLHPISLFDVLLLNKFLACLQQACSAPGIIYTRFYYMAAWIQPQKGSQLIQQHVIIP
jgi:hypothetical protein